MNKQAYIARRRGGGELVDILRIFLVSIHSQGPGQPRWVQHTLNVILDTHMEIPFLLIPHY